METIQGRIENKAEGKAKTGAPYLTFTINGKNYNSFNSDHSVFNVGDLVELELEQKGQYKNLVGMKALTEMPANGSNKPNMELKSTIDMVHGVVLNKTEKPHSYEFGKATARHKIYYGDIAELELHIEALKSIGLIDDLEDLEVPKASQ